MSKVKQIAERYPRSWRWAKQLAWAVPVVAGLTTAAANWQKLEWWTPASAQDVEEAKDEVKRDYDEKFERQQEQIDDLLTIATKTLDLTLDSRIEEVKAKLDRVNARLRTSPDNQDLLDLRASLERELKLIEDQHDSLLHEEEDDPR